MAFRGGEAVAKGYRVNLLTPKLHAGDPSKGFLEGVHFITLQNVNEDGPSIMWTKRGVVRLGFFIRSKLTRDFHAAAADLTYRNNEIMVEPTIKSSEIDKIIDGIYSKLVSSGCTAETTGPNHTSSRTANNSWSGLTEPFFVRQSEASKLFGTITIFKQLKRRELVKPMKVKGKASQGGRGVGSPELYDYQELKNVANSIRHGWTVI